MTTVTEERGPGGRRLLTVAGEGDVRFSVAPDAGGEVYSLRRRWRGPWVELLYRADRFSPARLGWRGGMPWLFPAVGRSASDGKGLGHWRHLGQERPMPIHGFAMAKSWEARCGDGAVSCRTSGDAVTLQQYPFQFELAAEYTLLPDGLRAAVSVAAAAANRGKMPFSLGNHLTLSAPFVPEGDAGAMLVRTPAREERLLSPQGMLTGETRPVDLRAGGKLRDNPRLFDCVLGGYEAGEAWVELIDPASFGVRVAQRELVDPGAPVRTSPEHFSFVFWGDRDRGFLCPEPWYGRPDSLNTGRGLVELEPGGRFGWEMTVRFL